MPAHTARCTSPENMVFGEICQTQKAPCCVMCFYETSRIGKSPRPRAGWQLRVTGCHEEPC